MDDRPDELSRSCVQASPAGHKTPSPGGSGGTSKMVKGETNIGNA
jgi:hypothetical protein